MRTKSGGGPIYVYIPPPLRSFVQQPYSLLRDRGSRAPQDLKQFANSPRALRAPRFSKYAREYVVSISLGIVSRYLDTAAVFVHQTFVLHGHVLFGSSESMTKEGRPRIVVAIS